MLKHRSSVEPWCINRFESIIARKKEQYDGKQMHSSTSKCHGAKMIMVSFNKTKRLIGPYTQIANTASIKKKSTCAGTCRHALHEKHG